MKITSLEAYVCSSLLRRPMWSLQPWPGGQAREADFIEAVIVKVSSSDGLVGFGQSVGVRFEGPRVIPTGSECKEILETVVSPLLVGERCYENEVLWRRLRRALEDSPLGLRVLSGVDMALWDLKGRSLGLPVCQLLGGAYRKEVRLYASKVPGVMDVDDEEAVEVLIGRLRQLRKEGYAAFKLGGGVGVEADIHTVELAREAVGPGCKIMFDAGCVYSFEEALKLGKALQELGVEWFETPLPPSDVKGHAELSRRLDVKIATDAHPRPSQVLGLLSQGAVDVVLSDVTSGGGITISRRIAWLTDLFGAEFSTHAGWHITAIGYAASAHLSAAVPNLNFQEGRIHFRDNPLGNPILKVPLKVENGFLKVPLGPGLGVEVNEEALSKQTK
jgi:L-alanine-DL-glutamate epimerase-like enolase superfamily enzyme